MGLFTVGNPEKRLSNTMKYAEDYETVLVENEKGKVRKKTTYKGVWFFVKNEGKETLYLTVFAAVCAVLSLVTALVLQFLEYSSCRCLFVILPQAVALFPAFYASMGALELPYQGKPMERNRYMHGLIRMCRAGAFGAAFMGFAFLSGIVYRIVKGDWLFLRGDILHLLFQILSGVFFGAVIVLLQKLEISERPNEYYTPEKQKK